MAHYHRHSNVSLKFLWGIILNILYVSLELGSGLYLNSLALISDAVHNLTDIFSLFIAWIGTYFSTKKPTLKRTYGYKRASIFSALLNAIILFIAIGGIIFEGIERLFSKAMEINTDIMWKIAFLGIIVNFGTALIFHKEKNHDVNIQSTFLHMLADGFITLGVIISAIIIHFTKFYWIDPLFSIIIAIVILYNTSKLFFQSFNLMMDAVPETINIERIKNYLEQVPGIINVHDLHIWAISSREIALTAHLVKPKNADDDEVLIQICKDLKENFHIHHCTIQFERLEAHKFCSQCIEQRI